MKNRNFNTNRVGVLLLLAIVLGSFVFGPLSIYWETENGSKVVGVKVSGYENSSLEDIANWLGDSTNLNESEVVDLVVQETNERRSEYNLPNLSQSQVLHEDAESFASYMEENDYVGHRGMEGRYPCGYAGENALKHEYGYAEKQVAEAIVDRWMNSEGHRENILRPEFSRIGVGIETRDGFLYAVQGFCG